MKTAEELAQEIIKVISAKPTWGNGDLFIFERLITLAIYAYADGMVKGALSGQNCKDCGCNLPPKGHDAIGDGK